MSYNPELSVPCWGISSEQLDEIFRTSKHLVCILEIGGRFKRLNEQWSKVLGWTSEELQDRPYSTFLHPEDLEKTAEYERNSLPSGIVTRFRGKDGIFHYLSWIGLFPIKQSGARDAFSLFRDITLESILNKERQEKILILNEHLHIKNKIIATILEIQQNYLGQVGSSAERETVDRANMIQHLVVLSNSQFGYLAEITHNKGQGPDTQSFNYQWEENTTWPVRSSDYLRQCRLGEEEEKGLFNNLTDQAVKTKKPVLFEIPSSHQDHAVRIRTFLGVPLLVQNEVVGVFGFLNRENGYPPQLIDWLTPLLVICARIVNEIQLRGLREEMEKQEQARVCAEAALAAKSTFLAHMSHELRTPLTGILGLMEIIDPSQLKNEDRGYFYTAQSSARLLLALLSDILDMSKIEADQLKLEHIPFNIHEAIRNAVELSRPQALQKGITLQLQLDDSVPKVLVGDQTRLQQIMFNLISNAVKFTETGGVFVSVTCSRSNNDQYVLNAEIQDTGIGISPEHQTVLFQPFSQADSTITRRFGGTGLGLYITKRLCNMMGGNVTLSSVVDVGTCAHVTLCYQKCDGLSTVELERTPAEVLQLPPLRVLVAEDNLINQTLIKAMLQKSGCTSVVEVFSGSEAVEVVKKQLFDIVLMDVQMPEMDGREATRRIRQIYDAQTLPIIGISAHCTSEERDQSLQCGMNAFLLKPFKRGDLIQEILSCVSDHNLCKKRKE